MKVKYHIFFLISQTILGMFAMFITYMLHALMDNDFGIDGYFGLFFIQPIMAIIISIVTLIIVFIVGLPIRINNTILHWWTRHYYVDLLILFAGILFSVVAVLPNFKEEVLYEIDGEMARKFIPNMCVSITSWFTTAFALLHLFPPFSFLKKMNIFKE